MRVVVLLTTTSLTVLAFIVSIEGIKNISTRMTGVHLRVAVFHVSCI